jgi:hypothetical protein
MPKGEAMQDDFGNEVHPQTIQRAAARMDSIQRSSMKTLNQHVAQRAIHLS